MGTTSQPNHWRAAIVRHSGYPLELVEVEKPQLQSGQVLVKLKFSGVCRSQLMEARGLRGPDLWLPHMLGHEGVGVVAQLGPGVTKVAPGDRVIVGWIRGSGQQSDPPAYNSIHGERINAGLVTTFSEYTVVSEDRIYHQPAGIDDRSAVLFGCALLTGAGMIMNEAQPLAGESVLINGLGGIGLAALIATRGLGLRVLAADPDEHKRHLAQNLGADLVLDPMTGSLPEQVRDLFPKGLDVAIDAAGTSAGIEAAFECIRYGGGRLIFASHPAAGDRISLDPHDLIRGKMIQGSWGGSCEPDRDVPRLARIISSTNTNLDFMTPNTYRLEEVNQALDDLEAQKALRPILTLDATSGD